MTTFGVEASAFGLARMADTLVCQVVKEARASVLRLDRVALKAMSAARVTRTPIVFRERRRLTIFIRGSLTSNGEWSNSWWGGTFEQMLICDRGL
jgi:hypothetical protein